MSMATPLTPIYTPVKKKQHISRFSATMANAKFLFLGETPRNKPGRQNRLREISRCFLVKCLGVSPRKVITWICRSKFGFAEFLGPGGI